MAADERRSTPIRTILLLPSLEFSQLASIARLAEGLEIAHVVCSALAEGNDVIELEFHAGLAADLAGVQVAFEDEETRVVRDGGAVAIAFDSAWRQVRGSSV